MTNQRTQVLAGTLDLLILKTLSLGVMHGYGLVQNIRRLSNDDPYDDYDAPTLTAPGTGREFETNAAKFTAAIVSTRSWTATIRAARGAACATNSARAATGPTMTEMVGSTSTLRMARR